MRLLPIVLTAALSALPALAQEDEFADHLSEKDGVRILHAWANATDGDHGFLFLEIENQSETEVTLTSAATEMAEAAHLVASPLTAGQDPVEIEALPIPAGSDMALEPGGVAFELHGLTQPLVEGAKFEAMLALTPLGEIEVHVEVEAADATQHSHAGHNH